MAQRCKQFTAVDSFVGTCTPRNDLGKEITGFLAKGKRRVIQISTSAVTIASSSLTIFYALLIYEEDDKIET